MRTRTRFSSTGSKLCWRISQEATPSRQWVVTTRTKRSSWQRWWGTSWSQLRIRRCTRHMLIALLTSPRHSVRAGISKWSSLLALLTKSYSRNSWEAEVLPLTHWTSNFSSRFLRSAMLILERAWWSLFLDTSCHRVHPRRNSQTLRWVDMNLRSQEPEVSTKDYKQLRFSTLLSRQLRRTLNSSRCLDRIWN